MRIASSLICAMVAISATPVMAKPHHHHASAAAPAWVTTWASAQMVPGADSALPVQATPDVTLRQVIHIGDGGTSFRLRLSNSQGAMPLHISAVHMAVAAAPDSSLTVAGSDRVVTFNGAGDIVIPPWSDFISDPVAMTAGNGASLSVSLYVPEIPATFTGHPGSRSTSYLVAGDHTADGDLTAPATFDHWYAIAGLDVVATAKIKGIIAFGDSITDGYGIVHNSNSRYPDDLSARLRANGHTHRPVLNLGIGGNRLLLDGLGPNALARFDRDVLSQSGAAYIVVLEGVNDLGVLTRDAPASAADHAAMVQQIEQAYVQMIDRAHSHGLKIFGGTIMPFLGMDYYHPPAATEADRQAVNLWIRTSGRFDKVIDFDMALRDPQQPDRLNPAYDSGDHLHPSPAGYKAMADSVDLNLFK